MEQKDKKLLLLCGMVMVCVITWCQSHPLGCCSLLTQLTLSDISAHTLIQSNGIYIIAMHMMPTSPSHHVTLQKHACRALRFLYSMERNRKQFKKYWTPHGYHDISWSHRIFPAKVLETFIDVGHYVKDLSAYSTLVQLINSLSVSGVGWAKDLLPCYPIRKQNKRQSLRILKH